MLDRTPTPIPAPQLPPDPQTCTTGEEPFLQEVCVVRRSLGALAGSIVRVPECPILASLMVNREQVFSPLRPPLCAWSGGLVTRNIFFDAVLYAEAEKQLRRRFSL